MSPAWSPCLSPCPDRRSCVRPHVPSADPTFTPVSPVSTQCPSHVPLPSLCLSLCPQHCCQPHRRDPVLCLSACPPCRPHVHPHVPSAFPTSVPMSPCRPCVTQHRHHPHPRNLVPPLSPRCPCTVPTSIPMSPAPSPCPLAPSLRLSPRPQCRRQPRPRDPVLPLSPRRSLRRPPQCPTQPLTPLPRRRSRRRHRHPAGAPRPAGRVPPDADLHCHRSPGPPLHLVFRGSPAPRGHLDPRAPVPGARGELRLPGPEPPQRPRPEQLPAGAAGLG